MFKSHRHKSNSSSSDFDRKSDDEKIEFKFSNIQAFQVPKGWDKLSVSLVSAKKGKAISKSGKALVRNGNCRWTETLSDSTRISRDNDSKDLEQCLFKLVVSMGSARSSILGEASINLAGYMSSKVSVPVSLPLKKCIHGTTLQVEVQCLAPRIKHRTENRNNVHTFTEDVTADDDLDSISNGSSYTYTKSFGSSSGNLTHHGDHGSRETSFSALGSHPSFDSEDSLGRESLSSQSNLSGVSNNLIGRQDSTGSQHSASYGSYNVYDSPTSNQSPHHSVKIPQNHIEGSGHISHTRATLPLQKSESSSTFLELEEVKTEDLRVDAGIWERNARKLLNDVECLRKECKDRAKHQTNLGLELSSSQTECACLKEEIKHLKEEAVNKQKDLDNVKLQVLNTHSIQKELEDELRFLRESNGNLSLQLKKTQDSNLELVSVLQEMEETIEKQKLEIENLSTLKSKYEDLEFRYNSEQKDVKEVKNSSEHVLMQKLNLEAELSKGGTGQEMRLPDYEKIGYVDLINEIESLKEKVQELERDCNELTDENMELMFKLKESKKDISGNVTSLNSLTSVSQEDTYRRASSSEGKKSESELWQLKEEMTEKEILMQEVGSGQLQIRFIDLESKCTNLELQLQASEEKACYLDGELQKKSTQIEQQECKIATLLHKLSCQEEEKTENNDPIQQEQAVAVTNNMVPKEILLEEDPQHNEEEVAGRVENCFNIQNIGKNVTLNVHTLQSYSQKLENMCKELELKLADLREEVLTKDSEIEELKADSLLKEIEIEALRHQQADLKAHISDLQKSKIELEGNIDAMKLEADMTSEAPNMLMNDVVPLKSSTDSHISTNKILDKKVTELENCREELELNLSELENENVQLSERVSGLEAQLRYMTEARECSRLEGQYSETQLINLQDEINRLVTEAEAQKVDTRHKLQEMQERWLEAEKESAYLKKANPKLQATAETLIGECNSLRKTNGELRQQRLELHKLCSVLEAELKESQNRFSGVLMRVEAFDAKFSSMLTEFSLKEKTLASELDTIHVLDNEYIEKLDLGESMLNQMYLEKVDEVEKLQQEVAHLNSQISATYNEREKKASEAIMEMHSLRADKDKLENTLKEVCGKLELSQKKLSMIQMESDIKTTHLMEELAVFKENHEILVGKHENLLGSFQDVRDNEEKLKVTVDELESKLRSTDCEKIQLEEETSSLRTQISHLQEEALTLKTSVNEMNFDNQRLEASLKLALGDYEAVKAERDQLIQKASNIQKTIFELEDAKRSKVALEEKILRLEGDLSAREALCAQDAELKNEVGRIKRTSSQLQWKIKSLEEEKEECLDKVRGLEEELKLRRCIKSTNKHLSESFGPYSDYEAPKLPEAGDNSYARNSANLDSELTSKIQFLENELAEALEANDMYKSQLKSMLSEGVHGCSKTINKEDRDRRISLLETELKELRERYLHMSLKCAEVEAQREQLVMKLKTSNDRRRNWFS